MVSNSYSYHPLSFKQVHKKVLNIFCPQKKEIVSQSQTQHRQAIFNPGCHLDHEPVFRKKVSLRSHPQKKQKSQLSLNVQNFFNITPWFPTAHGIELPTLHDTVPTDFPALISTTPDTSQVFLFSEHAKCDPIPGPVHLLFPLLKISLPPGFHACLLSNIQISPHASSYHTTLSCYHTASALNVI